MQGLLQKNEVNPNINQVQAVDFVPAPKPLLDSGFQFIGKFTVCLEGKEAVTHIPLSRKWMENFEEYIRTHFPQATIRSAFPLTQADEGWYIAPKNYNLKTPLFQWPSGRVQYPEDLVIKTSQTIEF